MKSFTSFLTIALLATSALGYGHGIQRVRRGPSATPVPPAPAPTQTYVFHSFMLMQSYAHRLI